MAQGIAHNHGTHSKRFARPVIVTHHAARRMVERGVSDALLLQLIDEGHTRYRDEWHLWAWMDVQVDMLESTLTWASRSPAGNAMTSASSE